MHQFSGSYPLAGAILGVAGALAGDSNAAVHLDGTQGIEMPGGADFAGTGRPFTAEVWIKPDLVGDIAFIIDNENESGGRGGWDVISSSSYAAFERYASDTVHMSAGSPGPLTAQSWHHVVAVCDGANQFLWIDGALAGSGSAPNLTLPPVPAGWMVGGQNCRPEACTSGGFAGAIDELAVYARALSQAEVQAHFQAAK
jgi:hypothetical protein